MTNTIVTFEQQLKREMPNISRSLPSHISPDRFERVLVTSVMQNSRLRAMDPGKVVMAAAKIAALGLLTDPHLGEAYLVPDYTGEVQARIGYRGLIKLARQSGQVANIYAHEVCANDHVECVLGDEKRLEHRPKLFGTRGEVVGYYAVIKYRDGTTDFEPMTIEQINDIRDRSDGWKAFQAKKIKDTPWASSYDEMAKKTCIRRLLKRAPASPELEEALRQENEEDSHEYSGRPLKDVTPQPAAIPARAEKRFVIADENGQVIVETDLLTEAAPVVADMRWTAGLYELNREALRSLDMAAAEAAQQGGAKRQAVAQQVREAVVAAQATVKPAADDDSDGMLDEPAPEMEAA